MTSEFRITCRNHFSRCCRGVPEQVLRAFDSTICPILRERPNDRTVAAIRKLKGWTNGTWRYRQGNYRVVYRVDPQLREVDLLAIGKRDVVYRHLRHVAQTGNTGPSREILTSYPQLVEETRQLELSQQVTLEPRTGATESIDTGSPESLSGDVHAALPYELSETQLSEWDISQEYWTHLTGVHTEGDFWRLWNSRELPANVMESVLDALYPPPIDELLNEQAPRRVIEPGQDFGQAMIDGLSMETFALKLDPPQDAFVSQFARLQPTGPWILRGGPGTGKSTMALYCIKELCHARQASLLDTTRPLRVLFTTYTRALVEMSSHLLQHLDKRAVTYTDVTNIDRKVHEILPQEWKDRRLVLDHELPGILRTLLNSDATLHSGDERPELDPGFLAVEIEEVIFGRGLGNDAWDSYREVERSGRGRRLGPKQRERVWDAYTRLIDSLERRRLRTFNQSRAVAAHVALPQYDYVFIDEAQDLSPAAIQMCVKLCHDPAHLFLTADLNQSIYGGGLSWSSVHEELKFRGHGTVLKRNYRTTRQLCEGIGFLWRTAQDETAGLDPDDAARHGEYPMCATCHGEVDERTHVEKFLRRSLMEERLNLSCAVILCPRFHDCEELAARLDPCFRARAMNSKNFDSKYQGVRVMPIHTAKGLEFPVVVIARVGASPPPQFGLHGQELADHNERLFLVACSRAQHRLMVAAPAGMMPPALSGIDGSTWELVEGSMST